jgi:hypothetical protein
MSISSRLIERLFDLPPATTHDIAIERDVKVPMPDEVVLLADHYCPRQGKPPTILIRSPYGRRSMFGLMFGRPFAERGFQVFIQSCRGTFGSGGTLDPFHQERVDGLATVEWLKKQDWFNGELVTFGPIGTQSDVNVGHERRVPHGDLSGRISLARIEFWLDEPGHDAGRIAVGCPHGYAHGRPEDKACVLAPAAD